MNHRITKSEWTSRGGLRATNTFRKQYRNGAWSYWRIN